MLDKPSPSPVDLGSGNFGIEQHIAEPIDQTLHVLRQPCGLRPAKLARGSPRFAVQGQSLGQRNAGRLSISHFVMPSGISPTGLAA